MTEKEIDSGTLCCSAGTLCCSVLTTESGDTKKMEGKAAGANGWLVKPFNPNTLLNVVKKFIG